MAKMVKVYNKAGEFLLVAAGDAETFKAIAKKGYLPASVEADEEAAGEIGEGTQGEADPAAGLSVPKLKKALEALGVKVPPVSDKEQLAEMLRIAKAQATAAPAI